MQMKWLQDTRLFVHVYAASLFLTLKLTGTPTHFSVQSQTQVNKTPLQEPLGGQPWTVDAESPFGTLQKIQIFIQHTITYSTSLIVLRVIKLLLDLLSIIGKFNCSLRQESVLTHTHWRGLCARR
jgi:hypothetical protein